MPISYDSSKIIPAPFVSISQEFNTADDGSVVGVGFVLELSGKIVADRGSPNSDGEFHQLSGEPADEVISHDSRLAAINAKQQAIRRLFSQHGRSLEIQSLDGSAPLKCNPRTRKINFAEGLWYETCDYTITLECDELLIGDSILTGDASTYKISKASNEWTFEITDEDRQLYKLTHTVSATGKVFYDSNGDQPQESWENARDYVLDNLGIVTARMTAPGVLDLNDIAAYNYLRNQSVNEKAGIFSVTESWLCYEPSDGIAAYESWEVETKTNDLRTSVSINGQINGLEVRNNTTRELVSTKWTNAQLKWASVLSTIETRAETTSGITLNPTALNTVVGKNELSGTITYSYEYDDRPSSQISGSLREKITIDSDNPADIFARHTVPGRAAGRLMQSIETYTERVKTVSIEAQMQPSNQGYTATQPNTDALILTFRPSGSTVYLEKDRETFSPTTGQYNRSVAWVWEV